MNKLYIVREPNDTIAHELMTHNRILHRVIKEGNSALEDIAGLLINGYDVIYDNKNLTDHFLDILFKFGKDMGADVEIIDLRDNKIQPYKPIEGLPDCVICDIDGTIALNDGHRGVFDYDKIYDDKPNWTVLKALNGIVTNFKFPYNKIIFMTGREDFCYLTTRDWLIKKCGFRDDEFLLYMRKTGDKRRDSIVKRELFENHVRKYYNPIAVFEDRQQVLKECWHELGLFCLDVGQGRVF